MSTLKIFEIHTYRNGAWKIDSVFDERELALMEAERIDRSNRYSAVRVVEESFNEATDRSGTRTIFRSTKAQKVNAIDSARRTQGLKVPPAPPRMKPIKPKKTITRQIIIATFVFTAIVAGGMIVLQLLNSLTGVSAY